MITDEDIYRMVDEPTDISDWGCRIVIMFMMGYLRSHTQHPETEAIRQRFFIEIKKQQEREHAKQSPATPS